jgi:PKD repeat protein
MGKYRIGIVKKTISFIIILFFVVTLTVTAVSAQNNLQARFSYCVDGHTVCFNDNSTGNPTSWNWNFGDGISSSEKNPCHIYAENEPENLVILSVSDSTGHESSYDQIVNIEK